MKVEQLENTLEPPRDERRAAQVHARRGRTYVPCHRVVRAESHQRLDEEWLGLLPEMLPFISELREDDDEMVERETQRWISSVEQILGEDLEGMLQ